MRKRFASRVCVLREGRGSMRGYLYVNLSGGNIGIS